MSWADAVAPLRPSLLRAGKKGCPESMELGELLSHQHFVPLWSSLGAKDMMARVVPSIEKESYNVFEICILQPVFRECLHHCTERVEHRGHRVSDRALTIDGIKRLPSLCDAIDLLVGKADPAGYLRQEKLFSGPPDRNRQSISSAQWYAGTLLFVANPDVLPTVITFRPHPSLAHKL